MYVERTKRYTLILIFIVLSSSLLMGYFFLKYQFKTSIDNTVSENYKNVEKLFFTHTKEELATFQSELQTIATLPGLSKAVSKRDYFELNRITANYFTNLKRIYPYIKILTFHSNDAIVLYRAHKPEMYGDKVSQERKLIMDTDRLKKSLSGFEVEKLDMAYRVTQPIFYKNIYVGNIEVGLDPTHFINELKTLFKLETGFILNNSFISTMLNPSVVKISDSYVLLHSDEKLKSYFIENIGKDIHTNKTSFFSNEPLIVKNNIPLLNHNSETIGYLAVGFETTKKVQEDNLVIYRLFGLFIIIIFVLVYILHRSFENILKYFTQRVFTDALTGLRNRLGLNKLLELNTNHVLILSDIKDFSIINELYGIRVGNEVLKQIGLEFKTFANKNGFKAFHIGGDEYVLYKEEEFFDAEDYNDVLESLHHYINNLEIHIEGIFDAIRIDINSGIVFDKMDSLEKAQMALKKTKTTSASYLAYTKQVDTKEKSEAILQIRQSIRYALEHNNIIPFFQPVTNSKGEITKYESLIRIIEFENGVKKVIGTDSFLKISKQNGFYVEITKRMIISSFAFFIHKKEKISINISPNDLFNISITDMLIKNIKRFDVPSNIVIEITEQESIEDFDRLVHAIRMLRNLGVLIAIDDFGSGYANYAHILVIKPDYLKIDGSLIQNILTDRDSKILVKSIVSFAKELGIITIAEYVENEKVYKLLKEYGVDEYQGYYFGKPQDLINADKVIRRKS